MAAAEAAVGYDTVQVIRDSLRVMHPREHIRPKNPDETKVTSPVIFFDNDEKNCRDVSAVCKVEVVRVPEAALNIVQTALNPNFAQLWAGHDIKKNAYVRLIEANKLGHDAFDIYSGMQFEEFKIINDLVVRSAGFGAGRAAVFDWDRNLTMVEGLRIPEPPGPIKMAIGIYAPFNIGVVPENYVEDMLTYLCGGVQRLQSLRNMFVFLRSQNIEIKILTNNPMAGNSRSALFKELVNTLVAIPDYDVEVWCSTFPPYNGDKGMVMCEKFPALCGMAGGRRRRHKTVRRKVVRRRKSRRSK